eukprot:GFUD01020129.1.p1 GENE.GFUD01020129.1~~GFUD01020129.1.p1  ORF type:complete len:561 (-),score=152.97 GFUD01020129.1:73-1755(-)
MPHLRPLHGVPSLSPAKRLVLLKGRGKGPAIKDIELEGESDSENEGEGGNWKRRMTSDSEDEFVPKVARDKRRMISDSEDEFVPKVARDDTEGQLVSRKKKVKARITPKRQAKITPSPTSNASHTPSTKHVRSLPQLECSPVPPVQRRQASGTPSAGHTDTPAGCTDTPAGRTETPADAGATDTPAYAGTTDSPAGRTGAPTAHTESQAGSSTTKSAVFFASASTILSSKQKKMPKGSATSKPVDKIKTTEDIEMFPPISCAGLDLEDLVATELTEKNECNNNTAADNGNLVKKPVQLGNQTSNVCLPPGYGSDKLAQVLICLLEEKVRDSSSHSERELFRKTIHVLLCEGCKDREKHNKVRCRRCEERDTQKRRNDKKGNDLANVRDKKTSHHNNKVEIQVAGTGSKREKVANVAKKIAVTEVKVPSSDLLLCSEEQSSPQCELKSSEEVKQINLNGESSHSKIDHLENVEKVFVIDLSNEGKNEELGKIDRDEIFSDLSDEVMETEGTRDELISANYISSANIEPIQDNRMDMETNNESYRCDKAGDAETSGEDGTIC